MISFITTQFKIAFFNYVHNNIFFLQIIKINLVNCNLINVCIFFKFFRRQIFEYI